MRVKRGDVPSRVPSMVSDTWGGFPRFSYAKLRYVDETYLDPPLGGAAAAVAYRANSIFDPDQSGVGHQPMGRDLWAQVYNHYLVIGARCKATFITTGTSGSMVGVGIGVDDNGSVPGVNMYTYMERGLYKTKVVADTANGNAKTTVVTQSFDAKDWFGGVDVRNYIYTAGAAMTTNPVEDVSFVLYAGEVSGTSDVGRINVCVEIEYYVLMTEPTDQPSS